MSITASEMTPADMAAVTNNSGYNGGRGWGGEWSMWIIIFLIFGFFGWGGGGFGGFGGGGAAAGAVDGYVLATDFANIERKIDGVNNGICDGFYAMNTGMLNGFAGVNQNISNGFMNAELSRCNQQAALMQQLNNMAMQNQQCCCDQRADSAQTRYDLATQGCDTRNTIQNTTRDIIDAMNNGFRGIDQRLTAQELAAKDAQIAEQNQRLFMAELRASQEAQTNGLRGYIDGQFAYYNPQARPAYIVPNPNCCYQQCG